MLTSLFLLLTWLHTAPSPPRTPPPTLPYIFLEECFFSSLHLFILWINYIPQSFNIMIQLEAEVCWQMEMLGCILWWPQKCIHIFFSKNWSSQELSPKVNVHLSLPCVSAFINSHSLGQGFWCVCLSHPVSWKFALLIRYAALICCCSLSLIFNLMC